METRVLRERGYGAADCLIVIGGDMEPMTIRVLRERGYGAAGLASMNESDEAS